MRRLFALVERYFPFLYSTTPYRALIAFAVGLAVIFGAWGSQLIGGLEPCELCLVQRWPYYVGLPVLAVVLLGWKLIPAPVRIGLTLVAMAAFIVSIGLGVYHAGVEYGFWIGPAECSGPGTSVSFSDLGSINSVEVVPCDEVQWQLFGISLAGFNALASAFIAFMLGWSALGQWRRAKGW